MNKIIETKVVDNVYSLREALKIFTVTDPETIYLEGPNGLQTFVLHLVEQTLTDGSIAYNLIMRETVGQ